ncbi:MAG: hypothetical protein ACYTBJ_21330 [Planctomycetota bacterium]|jgi:hypothetical protein
MEQQYEVMGQLYEYCQQAQFLSAKSDYAQENSEALCGLWNNGYIMLMNHPACEGLMLSITMHGINTWEVIKARVECPDE